ncbi:MAG: PDZ domain-containing protein [Proteobacteria bacterium]|nr:PDZ domain-containing protein [Pseudomonadota bacterium]
MTRSALLALIAAMGLAATSAPIGAQDSQEGEELQDARSELQEARQALEEAAREVARLSAQAAGPVVSRLRIIARPAVLGINISDAEEGVRVDGVTPGGPADDSGLATGDIIVAMDGAELGGDSAARVLIGQMENVSPGDTVLLTIVRDGDEEEIEVIAGSSGAVFGPFFDRDDDSGNRRFDLGELFERRGEASERLLSFRSRWGDMELVELTPEQGAYFGTETGILVGRAPSDDALAALIDGDVILDIGGREPNSPEHALRILASFESGETLELAIMRNQDRQTLEVEFP